MSDKKNKKTTDYRKVEQPITDSIFSKPNDLGEALDNLDAYDDWTSTDELFQNSEDATTPIIEKHAPYDDADKAKKVKKKAMGIGPIIPIEAPKNPPKPKKKPKIGVVSPALGNKVDVKATLKDDTQTEVKKIHNIDLDELMELLKDSDAYSEYLGLGDIEFEDSDEDNTDFPMDDRTATLKTADVVPFTKNNPVIPPPKPSLLQKKNPASPTLSPVAVDDDINKLDDLIRQKRMQAFFVTPHRLRNGFKL